MAHILTLKDRKFLCLSKNELLTMFRVSKIPKLLEQLVKNGTILDVLINEDRDKMGEAVTPVSEETSQDRDEHEIFAALEMFDFYGNDAMACFEMNDDFNAETKIDSLEALIENRKGSTTSDFGVQAKDGFRDFQLKRYRQGLNTEELFVFIKEQIEHYCNNLGTTNLFVILQSQENDISNIDFEDIQGRLSELRFRSDAAVLIGYNENNEFFVVNEVHPGLTRSQIDIRDSVKELYRGRKKDGA